MRSRKRVQTFMGGNVNLFDIFAKAGLKGQS